jgi:hypothetical protein
MRIILFLTLLPLSLFARGGAHYSSHSSIRAPRINSGRTHIQKMQPIRASYRSSRCSSCARDHHGKIKRSPVARASFRRQHPCPATGRTSGGCPGYLVDHVRALKHGGTDSPENMQWQTKAAARAKDRVE